MLPIFEYMFRSRSRSNWDSPIHWKLDEPRKSAGQQQREADEWCRRALRDVGML